jgi:hypothetical protein
MGISAMLRTVVLRSLVLLACAEAAARWVEYRADRGGLTFGYAPYRMLRMTRAPWPLNREGFRARELETYRGKFIIEFLGGSVCLGVGSNPGKTLPERLEEALHQRGLIEAAVVNLCQGGATTGQELAIYLQYGRPLNPEVVLSFDGANDLMHPRPIGGDDAPNLPYRNAELKARVEGSDSVIEHLALVRVGTRVVARWLARPARTEGPSAVPIDAIIGSYLDTLGVTRTIAQSEGALYAVLFQPTLHFAKPWSQEETRMWRERRPVDGPSISKRAAAVYAAAVPAIHRWADLNGVPIFDLTRVFENTSQTAYSDSVHFQGERGYAALFDKVSRDGLLRIIEDRYRRWDAAHKSAVAWTHRH